MLMCHVVNLNEKLILCLLMPTLAFSMPQVLSYMIKITEKRNEMELICNMLAIIDS